MAPIYDCSVEAELLTGMRLARTAIGRGDAFNPQAVQRLIDAKGRTRQSPPPVLLPGIPTLDALAESVPDEARALVAEFWPGALTIILPARQSLTWDLGETRGTVALRMPDHRLALELLSETGPLAVSSANLTGQPPATSAVDAERMLGDAVAVYLDGGPAGTVPSTIVDATGLGLPEGKLRLVRQGAIAADDIRRVVGADKCE